MKRLKLKRVLLSGFLATVLLMSGAFQALATDVLGESNLDSVSMTNLKETDGVEVPMNEGNVEPSDNAGIVSEADQEKTKVDEAATKDQSIEEVINDDETTTRDQDDTEKTKKDEVLSTKEDIDESVVPSEASNDPGMATMSLPSADDKLLMEWTTMNKGKRCKISTNPDWEEKWKRDWDCSKDWNESIDWDFDIEFNWNGFPNCDFSKLPDFDWKDLPKHEWSNIVNPFTKLLTFEKKWNPDRGYYRFVVMELYANDGNGAKKVAYFPIIKGRDNDWKLNFFAPRGYFDRDLKYHEFEYTVKEHHIHGYTTKITNKIDKFKFTKYDPLYTERNTFTITNSKAGWLQVRKEWENDEEQIADRPDTITYQLLQNGKAIEETYTLTKANNWVDTLTLPMFDEKGEIAYSIKEMTIDGYVTSYKDHDPEIEQGNSCCHKDVMRKGITIVNKRTADEPGPDSEMISIKGEKTWQDDEGAIRPGKITIKLMVGEEILDTMDVTPKNGKWLYEFERMYPKYDDKENLINYVIMEEDIEGYEMVSNDNFNLVNKWVGQGTLPDTGSFTIKGEKTWDDLMLRPEMITVQLLQNGKVLKEQEVKASENGKWLYEFTKLDKVDATGKDYVYTVKEVGISGYTITIDGYNLKNYQNRGTLMLKKVDKNKVGLPGAEFGVYNQQGKLLKTFTTGADGTFTMDLPLGMYRVKEVKAPAGYDKKDLSRLVILATEGQIFNVEIVNQKTKNGFQPLPDTGGKLPNTGGSYRPTLPKTGSVNQPIVYVLGLFAMFVGVSELTRKRKNT